MTKDTTHGDTASVLDRPDGSFPNPGRLALVAVVAWVVLEVAVRTGFGAVAVRLLDAPLAGTAASLSVGLPLMAAAIGWYAATAGRPPADWGFEWNGRVLVAGVLAALAGLVLVAVAALVDAALFDLDTAGTAYTAAAADDLEVYPAIAVVFLAGNAFVGPIAEEVVWRGIVQTELVERWGAPLGIGVTAVAFAFKHVLVELSVARITTLLALGFLYGLVRHRWGTGASTVTHVIVNLVGSVGMLALVF